MTDDHRHLGHGVYIKVPNGFSRAKSYDGFQIGFPSASISLKITSRSISEIKKAFSEKSLEAQQTKLLELREVKFGEIDSALFSMVLDKRRKTIRYLLAVDDGVDTYHIKAFSFALEQEKYEKQLKYALFSACFGEKLEEKPEFSLAGFDNDTMLLTRDGKLPTEAEDEVLIKMKEIPLDELPIDDYSRSNLLTSKVKNQFSIKTKDLQTYKQFLVDSQIYFCSGITKRQKNFIFINCK